MPALSVLMPCYNAASTLDTALESLHTQTFQNFEVICVDDGSRDNTAGILAGWVKKGLSLRVISQPHQGITAALNHGLNACQAPLVARMDADDRSHPERFARQIAFLQLHPEIDVVSCRVAVFPKEQVRAGFQSYVEWLNGLIEDAHIRREIFVESPLPHPSVVFRRDKVIQVGGYQEHGWAEDYDLWLRLFLAGSRFAKLPETLLEWRESPTRITRTDSRYSLENFLRLKAYYLMKGPLVGRKALAIWGAGMMGRRLGRQLLRLGAPLSVFIDIDRSKIGGTRLGKAILPLDNLRTWWSQQQAPLILAAVGARGARAVIRQYLSDLGFHEGRDWWLAA